jgi:putative transposase
MVACPEEYKWSSFQANGLGKTSKLVTPHAEYLSLGATTQERTQNYRSFFDAQVRPEMLRQIRQSTRKGLVIGSQRFAQETEALTLRRARPARIGRPAKSNLKE